MVLQINQGGYVASKRQTYSSRIQMVMGKLINQKVLLTGFWTEDTNHTLHPFGCGSLEGKIVYAQGLLRFFKCRNSLRTTRQLSMARYRSKWQRRTRRWKSYSIGYINPWTSVNLLWSSLWGWSVLVVVLGKFPKRLFINFPAKPKAVPTPPTSPKPCMEFI